MPSFLSATAFSLLAVTLGAVACSRFEAEDSATPTIDDDGGADGAFPPVPGAPSRGIKVTAGEAGKTVFIMQSRATAVQIKLVRGVSSTGPVAITVDKLPAGATADALTIAAGANEGTLTFHAAATTPQGAVTLDITALEKVERGSGGSAKLAAFVRGAPGALDTTFGTAGIVKTVFGAANSGASDARVLKDGSIIVAGHRANNRALARLTPHGARDTMFAGGGITNLGVGPGRVFLDVYEAPILAASFISALAAETNGSDLFRTNIAGVPDVTFNRTGVATVGSTLGSPALQTIALPDGKCLVLTFNSNDISAVVSRWSADGTLDSSYGQFGRCQLAGGSLADQVQSVGGMLLRPDGRLQVFMNMSGGIGGTVQGCTASGAMDPAVALGSTNGYAIVGAASDVARAPDGGVVLLENGAWRRLNPAFVIDTGIGAGGLVAVPLATSVSLVAQADGGVLVGGLPTTQGNFAVVHYTPAGALDPAFGAAGVSTFPVATDTVAVSKLVAQPDGRILVLGTSEAPFDGVIARIWP